MDYPTPLAEDLIRHSAWVRRLARRMVADETLAEDLAQDALASAAIRRAHIRRLRPWLAGSLGKLLLRHGRGERRRQARETAVARDEASVQGPDEVLMRAELQQRVVAAVLELEEPYRTTVLLRYLDELGVEDVAERMGCSPTTVRVRTHRGLRLLHGRLLADADGDADAHFAALGVLAGKTPAGLGVVPGGTLAAKTLTIGTGMKLSLHTVAAAAALVSATIWFASKGPAGAEPVRPVAPGAVEAMLRLPMQQGASAPEPTTREQTTAVGREAAPGPPGLRPSASEPQAAPTPGAAGGLRGVVVDRSSVPVTGATVELFHVPLAGMSQADVDDLQPTHSLVTPDDGRFRFESLEPLRILGARFTAPGFVSRRLDTRPEDLGRVELALPARLVGTVRDAHGQALADTTVVAGPARSRTAKSLSTRTQPDGTYVLEGLPGGAHVDLRVYPSNSLPVEASVRLAASGETRRDVTVSPRGTLEGLVIDYETGAPIAGARISARDGQFLGKSDAHGRFSFLLDGLRLEQPRDQSIEAVGRGEIEGRYVGASLSAHAEGYARTSAPVWAPAPGAETPFLVPLMRGGRVTGQVTHPDGTPAAAVSVCWKERPSRFLEGGATVEVPSASRGTRTDDRGHFELGDVPAAPQYGGALRLWNGELQTEVADACPARPGENRHLEIVLENDLGLHGRLFVNGRPERGWVWTVGDDGHPNASVETDGAGRFVIQGLAAGSHRLQGCTGDGTGIYSELYEATTPTPVEEGLEIHIATSFDLIEGHALDPLGHPLEGVRILAHPQRRPGLPGRGTILESSAQTDAQGSFRLRLEASTDPDRVVTLSTHHSGNTIEIPDVSPDSRDVEFVLPRLGPVLLDIRRIDTDGPVPAVRVHWRDLTTGTRASLYSGIEVETERGLLQLELPIGPIELVVSAPSLELGPRTFSVTVTEGSEPIEFSIGL